MKILHICPQYTEGFSYQENYLPKYQKKEGHDIVLVASNWEYDEDGELKEKEPSIQTNQDGIKIIKRKIAKGKPYSAKIKDLEGLEQIIKEEAPDLIFQHGCQHIHIKTVVDYVKKNPGVKVIVDNHADYSNSATSWVSKNILHRVIWRHYAKMIEPYAEVFYGVLPSRVKFLSELYGISPEKCELLVMGADDELVEKAEQEKTAVKEELGFEKNELLLITGGKIDLAKKQTLVLMEAVNEINRKGILSQPLKLIIFGSVVPELKEEFDSLCNENIKYLGWMKSEETYRYVAAADLAVYPGRHSVLWEQTAAQGIPMVVKYWDGTDHVNVADNVKFLYEDNPKELERVLTDIFTEEGALKSLKTGAEKGRSEFLYSRIAKKSLSKI